jgi:hypothetical protein
MTKRESKKDILIRQIREEEQERILEYLKNLIEKNPKFSLKEALYLIEVTKPIDYSQDNSNSRGIVINEIDLPTGDHLFWKDNEVGGRIYLSDEVGGGVQVWDTSLVHASTLLAAMCQEYTLSYPKLIGQDNQNEEVSEGE